MLGEGHTSSIIFEAELCAAILAMVVWRTSYVVVPSSHISIITAQGMYLLAGRPQKPRRYSADEVVLDSPVFVSILEVCPLARGAG